MEAADQLINSYFDNRPFDKTQKAYKRLGLKCADYWYNELKYILVDSSLALVDGVPEYYREKYPGPRMWIRDMDTEDKTCILNCFVLQLGMFPGIFPFSLKDFHLP